jgi:hypothetical protein
VKGGSYSVAVTEQAGTNGGVINLSISRPIKKTLVTNGSAQVVIGYLGQGALIQFQGVAGQYLALNVAGTGNACLNSGTAITILQPDGTPLPNVTGTVPPGTIAANNCYPGSTVVNLGPLPVTSTAASPYTVVAQQISPSWEYVGIGLSFTLSSPVTATVGVNGLATTNNSYLGQGAQVTFQGTAGQYLALNVAGNGYNSCLIGGVTIMIVGPDGVPLSQVGFVPPGYLTPGTVDCSPGSTVVNFGPLPLTSTSSAPYTIIAQQTGQSGTNSLGLTFSLSSPITLVAGVNGLVSGNLNYLGQGALVTFQGAQGQYLALNVAEDGHNSCLLSGLSVKILKPDGTLLPNTGGTVPAGISTQNICSTASAVINMGPLPVSSTASAPYTVLVQQIAPSNGVAGVSLKFTLSSPVTKTVGINSYVNAPLIYLGQSALVTFQGAAGQTLSLTATETGGNACHISGADIYILNPDGTLLTSGVLPAGVLAQVSCSQSTVSIAIPALPVTSNGATPYSILAQQRSPSNADSAVGIRFSLGTR